MVTNPNILSKRLPMPRLASRLKDKKLDLLLGLSFVISIFLLFRNLSGAIYLNEDEARAFTLLSSGPLIYAMGSPVYAAFGRTQTAVYIMTALLGVASLAFFYFVCRMWFDKKTACLAALLYAIFPLRVNYTRTFFPPVFIEFYFMLALYAISRGLLKVRQRWMVIGGFFCAAMFFAHTSSYNVVFALFCAAAIACWRNRQTARGSQTLILMSGCVIGCLAGFLILELGFIFSGKGYDYIQQSMIFNRYTHDYARYAKTTGRFFPELVSAWKLLPLWFFIVPLITVSVAMFVNKLLRQRTAAVIFFGCVYGIGSVVFCALVLAGIHTIYERHFVWLSSFYAIACSLAAQQLWSVMKPSFRKVFAALCLGFVVSLFYESYGITQETFKITTIRNWMASRSISKGQVVTSWWQLNFAGDREGISQIPGGFVPRGQIKDKLYWYLDDPKFMINWPAVYQAYRAGLCRYFVSSGMGTRYLIGQNDPVIAHVQPLVQWTHPYRYPRRPYYEAGAQPIAIYRLSDIFSADNFKKIQRR